MTRKKFIKMLMWAGMSRNEAAKAAALAQEARRPYFNVLGDLLTFHRHHFGYPLAWLKIRYTILYGYHGLPPIYLPDIDEVHDMDAAAVFKAILAGTAKKPKRVAVTSYRPLVPDSVYSRVVEELRQKDPVQLASELPATGLWPKKNPHRHDELDALRYNAKFVGGKITEVTLLAAGGYPLGGAGQ
jgi:hypothetical protein